MERMTYRDETGRARLTLFGKQMYCSTQATADCICKLEEALENLPAPKVMTLEEVLAWAEMPAEKRDPIFFEQRKGPNGWIANSACPKDYYLYCEDGDARCWTSRPSDAQREATPWLQSACGR